jgi:hypothetical protein
VTLASSVSVILCTVMKVSVVASHSEMNATHTTFTTATPTPIGPRAAKRQNYKNADLRQAGSNSSTVALRAKSETVKYGHKSHGTRTRE